MSKEDFKKAFGVKDFIIIGTIIMSFGSFTAVTSYRLSAVEKKIEDVQELKDESIRNESKLAEIKALKSQLTELNDNLEGWIDGQRILTTSIVKNTEDNTARLLRMETNISRLSSPK